jgi:microcystin degradation protein MlrC
MALIAVGGFQHETNTFAPTKADYRAFEAGAGRPGVQFGAAVAAWSRAPIFPRSGRGPDIKRQR